MSTRNKRKLKENTFENQNIAKKRRKLNIDETVPTKEENETKNKLFPDECDQKQFKMIYHTLSKCKSIHYIPSSIIYEISEFSTGTIEKCDNHKQ